MSTYGELFNFYGYFPRIQDIIKLVFILFSRYFLLYGFLSQEHGKVEGKLFSPHTVAEEQLLTKQDDKKHPVSVAPRNVSQKQGQTPFAAAEIFPALCSIDCD